MKRKIFLLILALTFGLCVGSVINVKQIVQHSISCNVVVEGVGTINTIFGPLQVSWVGSGVVIDSNGLVLTAGHCVEKATKLRVTLSDGRKFITSNYCHSIKDDIGLIRLRTKTLDYAILGSEATIGTKIYTVGNQYGLFDNTVTWGTVRRTHFTRCFLGWDNEFVFANMKVVGGNSGGGVYNTKGSLVGIVVMRYGDAAFAVPVDVIKEYIIQVEP